MTPEQKAFYNYGKARQRVDDSKIAIHTCSYGDLSVLECILMTSYKAAIQDAWNARKKCRAYVNKPYHLRTCFNCKHKEEYYYYCEHRDDSALVTPCQYCCRGRRGLEYPFMWEPRKEEK